MVQRPRHISLYLKFFTCLKTIASENGIDIAELNFGGLKQASFFSN
ncbi:MAG: hypothetical protein Ct9H300mP19_15100 [Dehalococcoidia bacterium]|nr:MAG: hypothetical protein Ct9H300mP19_15100 [Dehalococcoidia bacterium]